MRTRTLGSTAGEIRPDDKEPRRVAMLCRQGATTGWIDWLGMGGGGGWLDVRTEHGANRGDMSTKLAWTA